MERIVFGTSGWRGVLCEDFTFSNVRKVIRAIADHVIAGGERGKGLVVGYDSRFMGQRFAQEAARVLAGSGVKAYLCDRDTPTPVISQVILQKKTAGAVNFTASHNPYDYNGIKFSPSWGGPALPETTRDIERRIQDATGDDRAEYDTLSALIDKGLVLSIDPRSSYLEDLERKIDFSAIATIGGIAVDPLYGAGRGYLDEPLLRHNVPLRLINNHSDPYFGGFPPEPAEKYIPDLIALVKGDPGIRLGIATDGDADRFGIVDEDGTYIEPNYIIALLLDYLVRAKGEHGGVARSVATSHLVDAVAKKHGIKLYETPVGFKYIGELISQDKIIIGGEESAGLSIRGHVPEKDGILACFLVAEMVAREGRSLRELLERLYAEVGRYVTKRENITLSSELDKGFSDKMGAIPAAFAGIKVDRLVTIDGTKCVLADGSWVLFRKSGTEPVVRLYGESSSEEKLKALMSAARDFILR
ncbi:MAG: phosphoglucomutase/phosphomannomutase family protein [Geobacteraceae bacterium]|nr:phosphoglucomutase/phosphomannomutase family protein [Geobacteraceae bacterium]